jgi:hypothetical protein
MDQRAAEASYGLAGDDPERQAGRVPAIQVEAEGTPVDPLDDRLVSL